MKARLKHPKAHDIVNVMRFIEASRAERKNNMAKINILFDEKNYSIDEANLAPATDALKAHLETLGGGGTLEYGKEYTFKDVITREDCEKYIANAEPRITNDEENWYWIYTDTPEGTGEYLIVLIHHYLRDAFTIM
jgi:hypothetical protein